MVFCLSLAATWSSRTLRLYFNFVAIIFASLLSGDLIIKDLTATTLTGTKLYLGEDQYNLKSANGATVNVHTLEDEVVLIGGNNVAGTGVAFDKPVVAGDVKIAGDYRVTQLAGTPVADFAQVFFFTYYFACPQYIS